jgi:hypothetical protein
MGQNTSQQSKGVKQHQEENSNDLDNCIPTDDEAKIITEQPTANQEAGVDSHINGGGAVSR